MFNFGGNKKGKRPAFRRAATSSLLGLYEDDFYLGGYYPLRAGYFGWRSWDFLPFEWMPVDLWGIYREYKGRILHRNLGPADRRGMLVNLLQQRALGSEVLGGQSIEETVNRMLDSEQQVEGTDEFGHVLNEEEITTTETTTTTTSGGDSGMSIEKMRGGFANNFITQAQNSGNLTEVEVKQIRDNILAGHSDNDVRAHFQKFLSGQTGSGPSQPQTLPVPPQRPMLAFPKQQPPPQPAQVGWNQQSSQQHMCYGQQLQPQPQPQSLQWNQNSPPPPGGFQQWNQSNWQQSGSPLGPQKGFTQNRTFQPIEVPPPAPQPLQQHLASSSNSTQMLSSMPTRQPAHRAPEPQPQRQPSWPQQRPQAGLAPQPSGFHNQTSMSLQQTPPSQQPPQRLQQTNTWEWQPQSFPQQPP